MTASTPNFPSPFLCTTGIPPPPHATTTNPPSIRERIACRSTMTTGFGEGTTLLYLALLWYFRNCRVTTDKRVELITAYVPNHICFCHHASKRSKKEGTLLLHREHGSHIFRSYKACEYHKLCVWIVLAYLDSRVSPLKSMRDHEIIAFVCACSQYRFYVRNGNIINTGHFMTIL